MLSRSLATSARLERIIIEPSGKRAVIPKVSAILEASIVPFLLATYTRKGTSGESQEGAPADEGERPSLSAEAQLGEEYGFKAPLPQISRSHQRGWSSSA